MPATFLSNLSIWMENLHEIIERIHTGLEARTRARDQALAQARALTRFSAHAIRAIHRGEHDAALQNLAEGRKIGPTLCKNRWRLSRVVLRRLHPGCDQRVRRGQPDRRADRKPAAALPGGTGG